MAGQVEGDQPEVAEQRVGELIVENFLATGISVDEDDRGSVGVVVDDGNASLTRFNKMGRRHQKSLINLPRR
jgi:hypothetical protein